MCRQRCPGPERSAHLLLRHLGLTGPPADSSTTKDGALTTERHQRLPSAHLDRAHCGPAVAGVVVTDIRPLAIGTPDRRATVRIGDVLLRLRVRVDRLIWSG